VTSHLGRDGQKQHRATNGWCLGTSHLPNGAKPGRPFGGPDTPTWVPYLIRREREGGRGPLHVGPSPSGASQPTHRARADHVSSYWRPSVVPGLWPPSNSGPPRSLQEGRFISVVQGSKSPGGTPTTSRQETCVPPLTWGRPNTWRVLIVLPPSSGFWAYTAVILSVRFNNFFSVKCVHICFDFKLWRTWQFVLILKGGSLIGWFSPNLYWCQVTQLKIKTIMHTLHRKNL